MLEVPREVDRRLSFIQTLLVVKEGGLLEVDMLPCDRSKEGMNHP